MKRSSTISNAGVKPEKSAGTKRGWGFGSLLHGIADYVRPQRSNNNNADDKPPTSAAVPATPYVNGDVEPRTTDERVPGVFLSPFTETCTSNVERSVPRTSYGQRSAGSSLSRRNTFHVDVRQRDGAGTAGVESPRTPILPRFRRDTSNSSLSSSVLDNSAAAAQSRYQSQYVGIGLFPSVKLSSANDRLPVLGEHNSLKVGSSAIKVRIAPPDQTRVPPPLFVLPEEPTSRPSSACDTLSVIAALHEKRKRPQCTEDDTAANDTPQLFKRTRSDSSNSAVTASSAAGSSSQLERDSLVAADASVSTPTQQPATPKCGVRNSIDASYVSCRRALSRHGSLAGREGSTSRLSQSVSRRSSVCYSVAGSQAVLSELDKTSCALSDSTAPSVASSGRSTPVLPSDLPNGLDLLSDKRRLHRRPALLVKDGSSKRRLVPLSSDVSTSLCQSAKRNDSLTVRDFEMDRRSELERARHLLRDVTDSSAKDVVSSAGTFSTQTTLQTSAAVQPSVISSSAAHTSTLAPSAPVATNSTTSEKSSGKPPADLNTAFCASKVDEVALASSATDNSSVRNNVASASAATTNASSGFKPLFGGFTAPAAVSQSQAATRSETTAMTSSTGFNPLFGDPSGAKPTGSDGSNPVASAASSVATAVTGGIGLSTSGFTSTLLHQPSVSVVPSAAPSSGSLQLPSSSITSSGFQLGQVTASSGGGSVVPLGSSLAGSSGQTAGFTFGKTPSTDNRPSAGQMTAPVVGSSAASTGFSMSSGTGVSAPLGFPSSQTSLPFGGTSAAISSLSAAPVSNAFGVSSNSSAAVAGAFGNSSSGQPMPNAFGSSGAVGLGSSTMSTSATFGNFGSQLMSNAAGNSNVQPVTNTFGEAAPFGNSSNLPPLNALGNFSNSTTAAFGNVSSQPPSNAFGKSNPQPVTATFGNSTSQPMLDAFGSTNSQPAVAAFGNSSLQPTAAPFGNFSNQPASNAFGSATQPSSSVITFGNSATANQLTTNALGNSGVTSGFGSSTNQLSSNVFGNSMAFGGNSSAVPAFGAASTSQPTSNVFGNPTTQSAANDLGNSAPKPFPNAFGNPSTQQSFSGVFGSQPTQPAPNTFANSNTQQNSNSGIPTAFGNSQSNAATVGPFGSTVNASIASHAFGGSAVPSFNTVFSAGPAQLPNGVSKPASTTGPFAFAAAPADQAQGGAGSNPFSFGKPAASQPPAFGSATASLHPVQSTPSFGAATPSIPPTFQFGGSGDHTPKNNSFAVGSFGSVSTPNFGAINGGTPGANSPFLSPVTPFSPVPPQGSGSTGAIFSIGATGARPGATTGLARRGSRLRGARR